MDVSSCGDLHSVKWFKGSDRIAVVSGNGEVVNIFSDYNSRISIDHSPHGPATRLHLKSVQVSDEGTYVCESTFLEPLETCKNLGAYSIDFKVLVPPSAILILDEEGNQLKNSTTLGPLREGHTLGGTCEVRGARPAPVVGWYRSGKRLTDTVTIDESNGLFLVKSTLSLVLSRQELASIIECRVETPALEHIVSNQLVLDLQVRPTKISLSGVKHHTVQGTKVLLQCQVFGCPTSRQCDVVQFNTSPQSRPRASEYHQYENVRPTKISLSGVKHHTVQGTKVLLQCQVFGARPAANVTWYNSTRALNPDHEPLSTISTKTYLQNDGTFETVSQLIFTATRYENGAAIRCEGDNIVMRDDLEKPIHETLVLEVMYPPVVTVKPDNITINETEDFLLFCEYEANPASLESVRWKQNGKVLRVGQMSRYEGGNPEQTALLVKNASRTDIGSYTLESVRWKQNGKVLRVGQMSRYEGGNPEQTALLVKNASRTDIGSYTCELSNAIGNDTSDNDISVDVQYVPTVELDMDPESPIIENNESNVTLYCNVAQGNPTQLLKVRWYLDGQLLKELPECMSATQQDANGDDDDLCGIDPSKMLLQNVGRDFLGNYSCEGLNAAGWGQRSHEEELIVYYEPGNATIMHHPHIPVKRKSVTLSCTVDDGGNPNATRYRWLRGDKSVMDVVTPMWTVDPVGLDSRTNFSCYAYNEGGEGNPATVQLDVHAPPAFIQKLPPYTGALFSTPGISLSCRVECVPRCNISWFKDGMGIEEFSERYYVKDSYLPADPSTGDFESTLSILHFNMSAWPDEKLDIFRDSANYSCVSSNNSVGGGVRSATYFGVEYPPENTTVSNVEISVEEGHQPQRILCSAKAYPEPTYEWRRLGNVIAKGNALIVNKAMQRSDSGPYTCISFNRHGNHSAETVLNVLYRPNCSISRREIEDEDTLVCTAYGNPEAVDFHWSLKTENDTIDAYNVRQDGIASYLILEDDVLVTRTYRCVANNSVGVGSVCEVDVAEPTYEWRRLGNVIAKGNALIVNKAMQRSDSGPYTCISFNRHGNHSAETVLNVLYRPNCSISRREIEDEDTLVCTAYGNPEAVDFHWSLKTENDTIDAYNVRQDGIASYLILEDDVLVTRTYRCVANNSVGVGSVCEVDVAGHVLWWQRWDRMTLIILIASVFALLLAVIIVCIIIICICRKRRRQDKYHTDLSNSAAHRPGVLVHIKGDTKQNLAASRSQTPSTGRPEVAPGTPSKSPELPLRNSTPKSDVERAEGVAPKAEEEPTDDGNDELITFTNSGFIERILRRLRWRREHRGVRQSPSILTQNSPSQSGVQKKAASLLRAAG
uniref:Ig-like domain-containing protein n=2 Tax=Lutzomyia longipalpis TaxID=7200 RepID=A0A1B0GL67_LUTLO